MHRRSALRSGLCLAFSSLACAAPRPPQQRQLPAESAPSASTSSAAVFDGQAPAPARQTGCELQRSTPIEGTELLPHLVLYPQAGDAAVGWYFAGDQVLLLPGVTEARLEPTTPGSVVTLPTPAFSPALLVPLTGGRARAFTAERLEPWTSYAADSRQQVGILLVAERDDPCLPPGLHAFDPHSLSPLWHHPFGDDWPSGPVVGSLRDTRLLVQALGSRRERPPGAFAVLDAASGRALWQGADQGSVFDLGATRLLRIGERRQGFTGLDAKDGKPLWTQAAIGSQAPVAVSGAAERVALMVAEPPGPPAPAEPCPQFDAAAADGADGDACDYSLFVLSMSDGRTQRVPTAPGRLNDLLADGDDVFVSLVVLKNGLVHSSVAAVDARTGKQRWRTVPVACGDELPYTNFATGGSSVFTCTCDGVLRELDRATGRALGEFGVGWCSDFGFSQGKIALVLRDSRGSGVQGLALLDREALSEPMQETHVDGRVESCPRPGLQAPLWVRLGSTLVRSDARCSFHANVRGRGMLSAAVALAPKQGSFGPNRVALEAPGLTFGFDRPKQSLVLAVYEVDE